MAGQDDCTMIRFEDNGIGIPKDSIDKIPLKKEVHLP